MSINLDQILNSEAAKKLKEMNMRLQESRNSQIQRKLLLNNNNDSDKGDSKNRSDNTDNGDSKINGDITDKSDSNNKSASIDKGDNPDKGDIKKTSETDTLNQSVNNKPQERPILQKRKKVETIADLPEEIQTFLLDADNRNTLPWYVDDNHPAAHNIYSFELTDSVNARVHGFTPLMVLLIFGQSLLAEQMLDFDGIDLQCSAQDTGSNVFEDFTVLSILLMRLGIGYSHGSLRSELRNTTAEETNRDLGLVKRLIILCPELMHHRPERGLNSGFTELSMIAIDVSRNHNCFQVLQWFHEHKAKMELANIDGRTPLYNMATHSGFNTMFNPNHLKALLFLINCGADVNVVPKITEELLNLDDPYYSDHGNNVLHACTYDGLNAETVATFLAAGCKFNLLNKHHMTPQQISMMDPAAYPDTIRSLMEMNFRFEIPDGTTSDEVCAEHRRTLSEIYQLVEIFYDSLIMKKLSERMPVQNADQKNIHERQNIETIDQSIEHVACVDQKSLQEFDYSEFVKRYIEMGLPLGLKDATGRTPLHMACQSEHLDSKKIVALLLSTTTNIAITPTKKIADTHSTIAPPIENADTSITVTPSKESSADEKVIDEKRNAEQRDSGSQNAKTLLGKLQEDMLFAMLTATDDDGMTPLDVAVNHNSPTRFVLMNAIQPFIDRLVFQWRMYDNLSINNVHKNLGKENERISIISDLHKLPDDMLCAVVPFIPFIESFARKDGIHLIVQAVQKALNSTKIFDYTQKKAEIRCNKARQSGQKSINELDSNLLLYTQYTQNLNDSTNAQNVSPASLVTSRK